MKAWVPHNRASPSGDSKAAATAAPSSNPVAKCRPIQRCEWRHSVKNGADEFLIFSGGLPLDEASTSQTPASLTIIRGKSTTVLEMEHPIVTFITLSESCFPSGKKISM